MKKRQEKGNCRRRKRTPQKCTVKGLAEAFADLDKLLKTFKDTDLNANKFSLIKRDIHGALSAYKRIYDLKKRETDQANHHGQSSEERYLTKSLRQGLQAVFQEEALLSQGMMAPRVLLSQRPSSGPRCGGEDTDDPDPVQALLTCVALSWFLTKKV